MLMHQCGHAAACHDPRVFRRHHRLDARQRHLYHAAPVGKRQKLLGERGRAERPQARSAAPGEDNGVEMLHFIFSGPHYQQILMYMVHFYNRRIVKGQGCHVKQSRIGHDRMRNMFV
jgi:hypothetical protein